MWSDESVGELADQLEEAQQRIKQLEEEKEWLKGAIDKLALSDSVTEEVAWKIHRSLYPKYTKIPYKLNDKKEIKIKQLEKAIEEIILYLDKYHNFTKALEIAKKST